MRNLRFSLFFLLIIICLSQIFPIIGLNQFDSGNSLNVTSNRVQEYFKINENPSEIIFTFTVDVCSQEAINFFLDGNKF
ncbi:MAG: hypothetical protein ACXABI_15525, partial [Candidatus Hodarchaeales archaeon]